MATKAKADSQANVAAILVTESAANTFTSAKFNFPFSVMDKMALVIQRIEYWMGGINAGYNGTGDWTIMGLAAAASLVDIEVQSDPLLIDSVKYLRLDYGTAASGFLLQQPFIKDFTTLEGGGILVAPSPLYAVIKGLGEAAATSCWMRMYYTYKEMATDEYWQLVESRRVISS